VLTEHDIRVCKRVLPYLSLSTEPTGVTSVSAVYVHPLSPAEQLRRKAEEIEDRDADILAFRKLVESAQGRLEASDRGGH
jgi:hypothetical protein